MADRKRKPQGSGGNSASKGARRYKGLSLQAIIRIRKGAGIALSRRHIADLNLTLAYFRIFQRSSSFAKEDLHALWKAMGSDCRRCVDTLGHFQELRSRDRALAYSRRSDERVTGRDDESLAWRVTRWRSQRTEDSDLLCDEQQEDQVQCIFPEPNRETVVGAHVSVANRHDLQNNDSQRRLDPIQGCPAQQDDPQESGYENSEFVDPDEESLGVTVLGNIDLLKQGLGWLADLSETQLEDLSKWKIGRRPNRDLRWLIEQFYEIYLQSGGKKKVSWNTSRQAFEGPFLDMVEEILTDVQFPFQSRDALAQSIKTVISPRNKRNRTAR